MKFQLLSLVIMCLMVQIKARCDDARNKKCLYWDSPCLRAWIQDISPGLADGIPEKGIAAVDPTNIEPLKIDQDLKLSLSNLQVRGARNAIVDYVGFNITSKYIRLVYHTDFVITGQYKAGGYLFSLPFNGEGDTEMIWYNTQVDILMPFDIIKDVNGRDVFKLKDFSYSYFVKDFAQYQFDNLYYGDEQASERMQELLYQNWAFIPVEYGGKLFDEVVPKVFDAIRGFYLVTPIRDHVIF